jgi:hypothetical protein
MAEEYPDEQLCSEKDCYGEASVCQGCYDRLREALRSIANNTCCGSCREAALVAKAALSK